MSVWAVLGIALLLGITAAGFMLCQVDQDVESSHDARGRSLSRTEVQASVDFSVPVTFRRGIRPDVLLVRGFDGSDGKLPMAAVLAFPNQRAAAIEPRCVRTVQLRMISEFISGDPSVISAYPSRVFRPEVAEADGELPFSDGTVLSLHPRGDLVEVPEQVGDLAIWDVTDIYRQWYGKETFEDRSGPVKVPRDQLVLALRARTSETNPLQVAFTSTEEAAELGEAAPQSVPHLLIETNADCDQRVASDG